MKTFREYVNEGAKINIEVDFMAESEDELNAEEIAMFKKRKIKITFKKGETAILSGTKKSIISYLTDKDFYDLDIEDAKDVYPELFE